MAINLTSEYADFRTGHSTSLAGGHVWWHDIIQRDRQRIVAEVHKHAAAYSRRGYGVEVDIAPDRSRADLRISFPSGEEITEADIELLKGAMAATEVKAGWGGPG